MSIFLTCDRITLPFLWLIIIILLFYSLLWNLYPTYISSSASVLPVTFFLFSLPSLYFYHLIAEKISLLSNALLLFSSVTKLWLTTKLPLKMQGSPFYFPVNIFSVKFISHCLIIALFS